MVARIWGAESVAQELNGTSVVKPEITYLATGGYVVMWKEDYTNPKFAFQIYDAFGNKVGGVQAVDATRGHPQLEAEVQAVGDDGSFVIAWREQQPNTILSRKYDFTGAQVGDVKVVTTATGNTLGAEPTLGANGNGGWATAYVDNGAVKLVRYDADGNEGSRVTIAAAGARTFADVAYLGGTKHLVSYIADNKVYARIVEGANVGDEVIGSGDAAVRGDAIALKSPDGTPNGKFAVLAENGTTISFRLSSGTTLGQPISVSTTSPNADDVANATALKNGGLAIVYISQNKNPDGSDDFGDVFVRTYSANGELVETVLVNARWSGDGPGRQVAPVINEMADGRLAVSWADPTVNFGQIAATIVDARTSSVIVNGTAVNDSYVGSDFEGDQLFGRGGNDTLSGGAGGDTLNGGADIDTASFQFAAAGVTANLATGKGTAGEAAGDTYIDIENLLGSAHADDLTGDEKNNTIDGAGGNDTLSGGAGADVLIGGSGSDYVSYAGAAVGVSVNLGAGIGSGGDAEGDTYSEIENIIGSQHNDYLIGNGAANWIYGGGGNDTIDGNDGADIMVGGAGDDIYYANNIGDQVFENAGEGFDTVFASSTFALGANIEKLVANGWSSISLYGNDLNNQIVGNEADNVLDGGRGADTMTGGGGNDRYYVDDAGDVIVDSGGNDTVVLGANATFDLRNYAGIENLETVGATVNLTGNEAANRLIGNAFNNVIWGFGGNDTIDGLGANDALYGGNGNDVIYGGTGKDSIYGGAGNDTIYGGADNDTLKGEAGRDIFAFNTTLHKTRNLDKITDFKVRDDSIWLENAIFTKLAKGGSVAKPKALTSSAFWSGSSAHDKDDRIIYDKKSGALYYDQDGIGGKAQVKFATLSKNLALTKSDFFII